MYLTGQMWVLEGIANNCVKTWCIQMRDTTMGYSITHLMIVSFP